MSDLKDKEKKETQKDKKKDSEGSGSEGESRSGNSMDKNTNVNIEDKIELEVVKMDEKDENPFLRSSATRRTPPVKRTVDEQENSCNTEGANTPMGLKKEEISEQDLLVKKAKGASRGEAEGKFTTPKHQTDSSIRPQRSMERGLSVASETETIHVSDCEDNVWQDEEMTSPIYRLYEETQQTCVASPVKKKRKRNEQPTETEECVGLSKEMCEVLTFMTNLENKTAELKKHIKETPKTKTEIKTVSRQLVDIVVNLSRKVEVLKAHHEILMGKAAAYDKQISKAQDQITVGVQAEENEIVEEILKKKEDVSKEIERTICENTGWDGLSKILDHTWPASSFCNTEVIELRVSRERNGNVAIIANPNVAAAGQTMEEIRVNFPEFMPLLGENLEPGEIEFAHTKTETILSKGGKGETSRSFYLLPYEIDAKGINDVQMLYDILVKLKKLLVEHGTKKLKIIALGNLDHEYMRKCAEYTFRGTEIKMEIAMGKKTQKPSGKKEGEKLEKMVIKSEGKQYADILRTIKSSVNIDEVGIKIKSIKKTTRGEVMLELQGGADKAEALKRGILSKTEGTRVEIKNKDETVYVTGIDGDVDSSEIEEAIKKSIEGANEGDIKIVSIRPNQYGNQNATVAVKATIARELIRRGKIKIGWTMCLVRPRVNVVRCFRCLEFGHYKRECQGEDNTEVCLKCGNRNHKAKECTGETFCLTCKEVGHRADQTKCPFFRKLIREGTREKANAKGTRKVSTSVGTSQNRYAHQSTAN